MPAELAQSASVVLSLLATYLLHSTCLLLGIGFALGCYRRASPALRSGLWKLGAVAGFITAPMVTFSPLTIPLANIPIEPEVTHEQPVPLVVERTIPVPVPVEPTAMLIDDPITEIVVPESDPPSHAFIETTLPVTESLREQPSQHVAPILLVAGICMILGITRLVWQSLLVRRRFGGCRPLTDGPAMRELDTLRQQRRVTTKVQLLSSPDYPVPVAFGVFRWNIVLPDRAEAELSRDELRALLAHELAHLVRRDSWWLYFGRLLCTAFAYQPLNFWARRQWQQASEFWCDQWAVQQTGDRLALANCLTTVAGWRLNTPVCAGSLAATGSRSTLTRRVDCLVDDTFDADASSRLRAWLIAITAVTGVALLISVGPKATFAIPAAVEAEEVPEDAPTFEPAQPHPNDELSLLRGELAQLAEELEHLEALIARVGMTAQMEELSAKLRLRMQQIEEQAHTLETAWHATDAGQAEAEHSHDDSNSHVTRPNEKELTP